ncbi:MAG: hypothetical protein ABSA27_11870 [Terriglobales bacterium]|jgi:hypothetical protein
MSTRKKSLISQHGAVKKANSKNAKPSVSAPISARVARIVVARIVGGST